MKKISKLFLAVSCTMTIGCGMRAMDDDLCMQDDQSANSNFSSDFFSDSYNNGLARSNDLTESGASHSNSNSHSNSSINYAGSQPVPQQQFRALPPLYTIPEESVTTQPTPMDVTEEDHKKEIEKLETEMEADQKALFERNQARLRKIKQLRSKTTNPSSTLSIGGSALAREMSLQPKPIDYSDKTVLEEHIEKVIYLLQIADSSAKDNHKIWVQAFESQKAAVEYDRNRKKDRLTEREKAALAEYDKRLENAKNPFLFLYYQADNDRTQRRALAAANAHLLERSTPPTPAAMNISTDSASDSKADKGDKKSH